MTKENKKYYLIQVKTKGKEDIFIKEFPSKQVLQTYLGINYKRNKYTVFRLQKIEIIKK